MSLIKTDIVGMLHDAIALHENSQLDKALDIYNQVLEIDANQVDALNLIGVIHNQRDEYTQALEYLERAIQIVPHESMFLQNIGNTYSGLGQVDKAVISYSGAIRFSPSECYRLIDVVCNLYLKEERFEEAASFLATISRINDPKIAEESMLAQLSLLNASKNFKLCVEQSAIIASTFSDIPPLKYYHQLAIAYHNLQSHADNISLLNQGLYFYDDNIDLWSLLGDSYFALTDYSDAANSYSRVIESDDSNIYTLNNLALCYVELHDDKAQNIFRLGSKLSHNYPAFNYNFGNYLFDNGYLESAIEEYCNAILIDKNYVKAYINLGNAYVQYNQLDKAIETFNLGLQVEKDNCDLIFNLATAYLESQDYKRAKKLFEHCYVINTEQPYVLSKLYLLYRSCCMFNEAKIIEKQLVESTQDETPFISVLRTRDLKANLNAAKKLSQKFSHKIVPYNRFNWDNEKIHVGFITSDIKEHATMHLLSNMFSYIDQEKYQISIFCYSSGDNPYKDKIAKSVNNYFDLNKISDKNSAKLIHNNKVDILVDLKGHSRDARFKILAYHPAKVQVTYLGFPGTTGASYIDYIVADHDLIQKHEELFYTEKILYMPHSYQLNNPEQEVSNIVPSRRQFNLPVDKFVFATFNQTQKLDKTSCDLFIKILQEVQDSVLWIYSFNDLASMNLQNYFASYGIAKERLIFCGFANKDEHLRRIELADCILDTVIYNGHTTTTDCLMRSVPVIAKYGDHFASRVSASLLHAARLHELVAKNNDEYIELAKRVATNKEFLSNCCDKLKRGIPPLFESQKQVNNFMELLEKAYKDTR